MAVSVSPNGRNHYESGSPANEVLVATANGVVALTRTGPGASWSESRRMLEGKHAASIAIEPTRGVIFVGTHGDGLWASENGGSTWERRDSGIASSNIYGLNCVQDGSEVRLYAGTEPAHLYVSADLGRSWTELPNIRKVPSVDKWTFPGPPHEAHVKNIVFDPKDPNTIYAGVEVGGAFKSTDGGQTWRELSGFYEDVHRLFTVPTRPDDVYMATGRGLYHSANAGDTWEELPLPDKRIAYPDALVILPQDPNLMFTAGASSSPNAWRTTKDADAAFARSRDAGRTWTYVNSGLPDHIRGNIEALTMHSYPGGLQLFAGTTDGDVFYSEDEGEHWATIARSLPPVSKGGHYRNLREDLVGAR
ncbi:MAG TPA: glycosyl hydrolase [Chloroflexota bacterium]|nr:glycosyl hydrolase [Chloroflexota bacterium]